MLDSRYTIKPIQTQHNGYLFKSRLEYQWAVFFEAIGIRYEYEKEGYDLGDGIWYLPDFWLPDMGLRSTKTKPGIWVEVKPTAPTKTEEEKMIRLVRGTKLDGLIVFGQPRDLNHMGEGTDAHYQYRLHDNCACPEDDIWWDNNMWFVKCRSCGAIKVEFAEGNYMTCELCGSQCDDQHPDILKAIAKARSAPTKNGRS